MTNTIFDKFIKEGYLNQISFIDSDSVDYTYVYRPHSSGSPTQYKIKTCTFF
jgi:hypothetical protein